MKDFVVYDKRTGAILRTGRCPDKSFRKQAMSDEEAVLEGIADDSRCVVAEGKIKKKPEKKKTAADARNELAKDMRGHRDLLLISTVDRINAVWWNKMSDEDKQKWMEYRQALLDVPQQSGFPEEIMWPEHPDGK